MAQSPPAGLVCGGIAILVMVLALAGVVPRAMFLVGAAALVGVAYTLDKRFKANGPPVPSAASIAPEVPPAVSDDRADGTVVAPPPAATPPATPSPAAAVPTVPSAPPPSLLAVGDLKAEHARLTQELTDRVDADEDVRFEKFMRLRRIDEELERQQGAPPSP